MIRAMEQAWSRFFFTPRRATALALYRMVFGAIVLLSLCLAYPDWLTWYGENGLLTLDSLPGIAVKVSLFSIWPRSDAAVMALFWIAMVFAGFLMAGFLTRTSSIVIFVVLLSLHDRNPMILSGGDTLLRLDAFFLMFAPAGAALSVDRWIATRRGGHARQPRLVAPWAQRMLQIQTAIVYVSTFVWKLRGHTWVAGTALYYALHLSEFHQFTVPGADNAAAIRFMTWSTLAIEFSLGTLVWVRRLRYWVLLAGVCLHAAIEYAMNIPLFSLTIVATYLNFIDPRDLDAAWAWIHMRWRWMHARMIPVRCL